MGNTPAPGDPAQPPPLLRVGDIISDLHGDFATELTAAGPELSRISIAAWRMHDHATRLALCAQSPVLLVEVDVRVDNHAVVPTAPPPPPNLAPPPPSAPTAPLGVTSIMVPGVGRQVWHEWETDCQSCHRGFTWYRRKHHCRTCGHTFCGECSRWTGASPGYSTPVRLCAGCATKPTKSVKVRGGRLTKPLEPVPGEHKPAPSAPPLPGSAEDPMRRSELLQLVPEAAAPQPAAGSPRPAWTAQDPTPPNGVPDPEAQSETRAGAPAAVRAVDPPCLHRVAMLDVVFVMDGTISMGPYLDGVCRGINEICARLTDMELAAEFGLVIYWDHPPLEHQPVPTNPTTVVPLSPSPDPVRKALAAHTPVGGWDWPECVACGLDTAARMAYREPASRCIILVADAPPHGYPSTHEDNFPGGCPLRHTVPDAHTAFMTELRAHMFCVGCEENVSAAKAPGPDGAPVMVTVMEELVDTDRERYITLTTSAVDRLVDLIVAACEATTVTESLYRTMADTGDVATTMRVAVPQLGARQHLAVETAEDGTSIATSRPGYSEEAVRALLEKLRFRTEFRRTSVATREAQMQLLASALEIEERIGRGGMGEVFAGRYRGESVAVKAVPLDFLSSDGNKYAVREVMAILNLRSSPRFVNVKGFCMTRGTADTRLCIVMERYKCDLSSELRNMTLGDKRSMEVLLAIADGLRDCEQRRFVLRDLKPANILVSFTNKVVISDLGLAKFGRGDTRIGSPAYMAPEAFDSGDATSASDVWSFGVLVHAMDQRRDPQLDMVALRDPTAPRPALRCSNPALQALVDSCLAVNPSRRPRVPTVFTRVVALAREVGVVVPGQTHRAAGGRLHHP